MPSWSISHFVGLFEFVYGNAVKKDFTCKEGSSLDL
jgi:hypothetical protein